MAGMKEVLIYIAQLYHQMGCITERDEIAKECKSLFLSKNIILQCKS